MKPKTLICVIVPSWGGGSKNIEASGTIQPDIEFLEEEASSGSLLTFFELVRQAMDNSCFYHC